MELFRKLKEMRMLLIDDDEWIRDSLSLFFEGEGCHLLALETKEILTALAKLKVIMKGQTARGGNTVWNIFENNNVEEALT